MDEQQQQGATGELRERKKKDCKENEEPLTEEKSKTALSAERSSKYVACQRFTKLFCGCFAAITSGMMYTVYLSTYHERKFWFSTRPELEREITFQGDGAIYYSFFKELLRAPSFEQGLFELTYNNKTVSMKTLNAVRQMSLYPELMASALYRISASHEVMEPMHFYISMVFGLQGIYVTALFVTSWIMSGTWLAGMLAAAWFIINRTDTTRMDYSIPLRENWALPYFAVQVAALTGYLKNIANSSAERLCFFLVTASTYTFMVIWEYSHYLLFLQSLSLLMMDYLLLVQKDKVHEVQKIYLLSLLLGYLVQFENSALLLSPLLSLVAGSILANCIQMNMKRGTFIAKVMDFVYYYLVFTIAVTLHFVIKTLVADKENGHILQFLEAKFGLSMTNNFTTSWLLCQESLQSPSADTLLRLTQSSLLPFYGLVFTVCCFSMSQMIFRRICGEPLKEKLTLKDGQIGARPEVIYHIIHSALLGSFTMVFEGVKYLWTPYVCMLAAFGVCSPELWVTLFKWIRLKSVQPVLLAVILSTAVPTVIGFSLWREHFPRMMMELSELREFYDLDTIELMRWIKREAPLAAVFAGSPQLMGAIKLCTGSKVTSLPLYTNEDFMKRNENLYQIYSLRSAEDIYKILTSYKASYVIIEDSICNEVGTEKGCRVKDLLDVANGHMVNEDGDSYSSSKYGRFCHEIKLNYSPYVNYFTLVYWNRSYFVYKINTVISFQY
ncbi:putative C-mannosyltransferase DPY19L4 [Microcaecilia unicolor]|uniref:Probable C-mannosyltransferase DPY19L4 n=1 Tax=Microcaecilia unicolor TaxID=1415580 RepID=A0A6P7ZB35_9AMPH|nr:probable C-mannosyltransferase DPY19L4 [Microcaecilia unicolor]